MSNMSNMSKVSKVSKVPKMSMFPHTNPYLVFLDQNDSTFFDDYASLRSGTNA